MPDWVATLAGWSSLVLGALGLWRGVTLLLRGQARDTTGTPGWSVLIESSGLTVLGVVLLLGDGWLDLIWSAVVLMAIGAVSSTSRWLQRRASLTARAEDPADT